MSVPSGWPSPPREVREFEIWAHISTGIVSCDGCAPEQPAGIEEERLAVRELIHASGGQEADVPTIGSKLRCRGCNGAVDVDEHVVVRDGRWRRGWALEWMRERFREFQAYLEQYPYLGLDHPVGRAILDRVAEWPRTSLEPGCWFRAVREPHGGPPKLNRMRPPPPRYRKSEGRFDHRGHAWWYLSSSAETALAELEVSKAYVSECRVERIDNVVDLTLQPLELSRDLIVCALDYHPARDSPDPNAAWKPEYYIPRFLADCARSVGLTGIRYTSVKEGGMNLVLFLDRRTDLVKPLDPKLWPTSDGPNV